MSDSSQPLPSRRHSSSSAISSKLLKPLEKTQLWARVLSILGFTIFSLAVLVTLGTFATGRLNPVSLISILLAAIFYFYPSYKLGQYASRIKRASVSQSESSVIAALEAQHAIWRFIGIIGLISVVFFVMFIILSFANAFA